MNTVHAKADDVIVCTFSSDNWTSDVELVETSDGRFDIRVAIARHQSPRPCPSVPHMGVVGLEAWAAARGAQALWLETADFVDIAHPLAGACFTAIDADACVAKLDELAAAGFTVPDRARFALRDASIEA